MFEWLTRLFSKPGLFSRWRSPSKSRTAAAPASASGSSRTAQLLHGQAEEEKAVGHVPDSIESGPAPLVRQKLDPSPGQPRVASILPADSPTPTEPAHPLRTHDQARAHLDRLNGKIGALAERFAEGAINRTQFQQLYGHYQREIQSVEAVLLMDPNSDGWKKAVSEGQSMLIRRRAQAQVMGFSIYDKESGIPLRNMGQFGVDPALFVPMLSAYRSATEEIFGGGVRSTQIEGGKWLCFVPGKITTTLALFTMEPSNQQIKALEELQDLFENANTNTLGKPGMDPANLVCPHEFFINHPL